MNAFLAIIVGRFDVFKLVILNRMFFKLSMSVLYWGDFVEKGTCGVSTLHRIGVCKLELSVENYSSCTLLSHVFIFVLRVHMVLAEGTIVVFKLDTVQGK